ncbi:hypothetical protein GGR50DRAFT_690512 [Xylaria sp. CBS 124048]|nr:hypothetical protein GGR50DRAFT_690512 [Xylaria sp. CBS 124048]
MGLPLYKPPVESDLPSRSDSKTTADPAHARSPIRRATERRRRIVEARELRLRSLSPESAALWGRGFSPEPEPDAPANETARRRDENELLGEQARRLATGAPDLYPPLLTPSQLRRLRPDLFPSNPPSGSSAPRVGLASSASRFRPYRALVASLRGHEDPARSRAEALRRWHAARSRYIDGLGDRDRSMSPDDDAGWNTLQSTLAPDPQRPSVGSSFTSTNVATTTPEVFEGDLSAFAIPDDEPLVPCDPVATDGHDYEQDDNEQDGVQQSGEQQSGEPSRQQASEATLASAQPTADSEFDLYSADANHHDNVWLSGMHRIVRGLASRSDIPDEWWAQAGLSRSMSWDDTN